MEKIADKKYRKLVKVKFNVRDHATVSITCDADLKNIISNNVYVVDGRLEVECSIIGGKDKLAEIKPELDRIRKERKQEK